MKTIKEQISDLYSGTKSAVMDNLKNPVQLASTIGTGVAKSFTKTMDVMDASPLLTDAADKFEEGISSVFKPDKKEKDKTSKKEEDYYDDHKDDTKTSSDVQDSLESIKEELETINKDGVTLKNGPTKELQEKEIKLESITVENSEKLTELTKDEVKKNKKTSSGKKKKKKKKKKSLVGLISGGNSTLDQIAPGSNPIAQGAAAGLAQAAAPSLVKSLFQAVPYVAAGVAAYELYTNAPEIGAKIASGIESIAETKKKENLLSMTPEQIDTQRTALEDMHEEENKKINEELKNKPQFEEVSKTNTFDLLNPSSWRAESKNFSELTPEEIDNLSPKDKKSYEQWAKKRPEYNITPEEIQNEFYGEKANDITTSGIAEKDAQNAATTMNTTRAMHTALQSNSSMFQVSHVVNNYNNVDNSTTTGSGQVRIITDPLGQLANGFF
jgi:hypothetical protein